MVSLKDFQKKCAENKRLRDEMELVKLREEENWERAEKKRMEEWNILMDAQERFGDDYKPKSSLSILIGSKDKCPCCDDKLNKNIIKEDEMWEYHIMYCNTCGYRFARVMRR